MIRINGFLRGLDMKIDKETIKRIKELPFDVPLSLEQKSAIFDLLVDEDADLWQRGMTQYITDCLTDFEGTELPQGLFFDIFSDIE